MMDLISLQKCEDLQETVGKTVDMNVYVLFLPKEQNWQIVNFGGTSVIKKHYYSWQDIEDMCSNIVKQMYKDHFHPDYILGITRGGNIPATIISNMLDIPCEAMKVSFRNDSRQESHWLKDVADEKKILIVDDINDTGATFNWIQSNWGLRELRLTKFASLTENLASDFGNVDYHVHEVNKAEKDVWLVYPWENVGEYGNI